jgi:hypothetical protein
MNRLNQILVAVLAAQLLIAGAIYFNSQPLATAQIQRALLDIDKSKISRITILDADGSQTVVSKVDDHWQLPDYHQLPASESKVVQTLDALAGKNSGWPVATTESGRKRFKVQDDNFQRKIVLGNADEALQTLYLGKSPGYRQVYVRRAGEDEVYAVKLDSYALTAENNKWLDPTLLQLKGDIDRLQGPDYVLARKGKDWHPAQGDGEVVSEKIKAITDTLAQFRVTGATDKTVADIDYELVVTKPEISYTYRFFKQDDNRYVSRNDYALAFTIGKTDYEKITSQTATQLVKSATPKKQG